MLEKLRSDTMVSENLLDGFVVVQILFRRHLGLYHRQRNTVNHQYYVEPDIFVTRKLELVGYDKDVIFWTCVNKTNNLGFLPWIQDDAFFSFDPFEEFAVAVDVV